MQVSQKTIHRLVKRIDGALPATSLVFIVPVFALIIVLLVR